MTRRTDEPGTGWIRRLWSDIKASTDASILGVLRFLGLLYGPIDTHLPIDQSFRRALRYRLPKHANWRHALGGIAYLLMIVLVVTGVLLSFYYRPSAEEAYQSIQHIVSGVSFGWLFRDLHVWAANLIVIAVLFHMARVFFGAAYKPPRETNWLVGLFLLFVVLAFGATGYLLPWDQWSYWTVTQGLDVVQHIPIIGGAIAQMLRGDPIVSGATLSRFFAWHVILLPWIMLGLLMLHFALVRKHGIAPPVDAAPDAEVPGERFFPEHLIRAFVVAVVILAVVISLAALYPRPVSAPADPARVPDMLMSNWVMADVSRAIAYYLGPWGFAAFMLLGVALAILPLVDRHPERKLRRRPLVAALGFVFFIGFLVAWVAGRQLRAVPLAVSGESQMLEQPAVPAPPQPVPHAVPDTVPAGSTAVDTAAAGRTP